MILALLYLKIKNAMIGYFQVERATAVKRNMLFTEM